MTNLMHTHVTSQELSRRLEKAGVPQKSYFSWKPDRVQLPGRGEAWLLDTRWELFDSPPGQQDYAAFLSSEIGEMLPSEIKNDTLHIAKCGYGEAIQWQVFYTDDDTYEPKTTFCADTLVEAMGKMLEYLLINGLITL